MPELRSQSGNKSEEKNDPDATVVNKAITDKNLRKASSKDGQVNMEEIRTLVSEQVNQTLVESEARLMNCLDQKLTSLLVHFDEKLKARESDQPREEVSLPAAEDHQKPKDGDISDQSQDTPSEHRQPRFSSTRVDEQPNMYWPPNQDRQPIVLNQIEPEPYSGDKRKARSWLRQYEAIMKVNGYGDQQKLTRAIAYMKGPASHWYNVTTTRNPDMTWYGFTSKFLRHFCGSDGSTYLYEKIEKSKQSVEEHPSVFLMRIIDLCHQYDPKMPEALMMKKVHNGLRPDVINNLIVAKTVDEWTVDWLESVFNSYKQEEIQKPATSAKTTPIVGRHIKPASKPARDISTWQCYNCDNKGHLIKDCPMPKDDDKIKAKLESIRQRRESNTNKPDEEAKKMSALNFKTKVLVNHLSERKPSEDILKPVMTLEVNGLKVSGRVDSGADITAIPADVANKLKLNLVNYTDQPLLAVNNSEVKILGLAPVFIKYKNVTKLMPVVVLPHGQLTQALWGWDFLYKFKVSIDFSKPISHEDDIVSIKLNTMTSTEHPIDKLQFGELKENDKLTIIDTLKQFANVFSKDDLDIGRTSTIKHRILLSDEKPVSRQPYRVPFRSRDSLQQAINNLLSTGAIRPSKSPYASPVFFVDKDGGKAKRLVADYRALNSKTISDKMPMPHPEDIFGMLAQMTVFSKLDITSMFNQIEIDERDIEKTAITTPFGLYECPLMPFGLVNAPATAVRLMREVLRDINGRTCYVYFDDIIVFATDINQLVIRCREVLARLREHNLKLKPSKCVFGVDSVKFLGHIISAKGIQVDPTRIEKVKLFPVPKNPSHVRSFHGLVSYNRKFIKDFAKKAKPLTKLMGKVEDFVWTQEAQTAFESLRDALTEAPILVHFNPEAELELRTDASSYAIGAILYQKHPDPKQTGVILYHSKTLTETQRRYSATEREALAAFNAIMELQHFLYGKRFTLVTDHQALSLFKNHRDAHHRVARWVAQLQCFDFVVKYKSGQSHVDADCMSRLVNETDESVELKQSEYIIRALTLPGDSQPAEPPDVDIDIKAEQRADLYCKRIIDILESTQLSASEKAKRASKFTLQDDILYRFRNDIPLLVIPEKRKAAVLLSCHDSSLAGHLGYNRTYSLAKYRYYWPKMRKDLKKYVASCSKCQRRKASNQGRQGYTRPLPIAEDIFDTVGIDLINKLPRSHAGYNTILVITDNLSKYVVTVPLKDEKADTISFAFFTNFIAKFGCPKIVISDRGLNIAGRRAKDFYDMYGIKRHLTSAYHPQSNGQTERFNRTLAASLTLYVDKNQKNWSDYLAALTFAYNITEHSVTHVAPFEFVYGRRPRLPLDNLLKRNEFVDPMRPFHDIRSAAAIELIKEQINKSQATNKKRLDAKLKPNAFKVGDLVLFERPTRLRGQIDKLTYTYTGPYKISKKLGDVTFEITAESDSTDRKVTRVVHPYSLKLYNKRDVQITDDIVDDPHFVPIEEVENSTNEPEQEQQPEEPELEPNELPPETNHVEQQPASQSLAVEPSIQQQSVQAIDEDLESIITLTASESSEANSIEHPPYSPLTPPRPETPTEL